MSSTPSSPNSGDQSSDNSTTSTPTPNSAPNSEPPTSPPPDVIPPPSPPPPPTIPASSPPPSVPPPSTPVAPPPSVPSPPIPIATSPSVPPPITPSTPIGPPPSVPPPSTPIAPPPIEISPPPPIVHSSPPPKNSSSRPPSPPNAPPPSVPPPSTPNAPPPFVPTPITPSTPIAPPPSVPPPSTPIAPPPSVPPPSTPIAPPHSVAPPSTPIAPPPIEISPPPPIVHSSPPPKNSSSLPPSAPPPPLKPEVPPPSPSPPVHTSSPPSLTVPPQHSPPPPALFSPPSVPALPSPPPPPQNNTLIPTIPTTPSTPIENPTADSSPNTTNNTTASTTREAGGFPAGGTIAIVFVGLLALSLVVFSAWFVQRRKKKRTGLNQGYMVPSPFVSSPSSDSILLRGHNAAIGSAHQSPYHSASLNGNSLKTNLAYNGDPAGNSKPWFTYEELVGATNDFSEDNLLGEGGFGCVYKGYLADGREVAVKQLKIGGRQGEREFRAEVDIISRIHHRHLVSIVGYCISDFQRLLIYDYVPNNTLHYHLHENVPVMTWVTRFKVASGAARGIAYLHEDCTPRIIHRDIKSANILLDNNFEAKVADFGLAKLALELEAHTHVSTRVMGTFGYMAPEYATTGKLTEKSDVFSFGVVLLELITGRKPVDSSQPLGDEGLVGWIWLNLCCHLYLLK